MEEMKDSRTRGSARGGDGHAALSSRGVGECMRVYCYHILLKGAFRVCTCSTRTHTHIRRETCRVPPPFIGLPGRWWMYHRTC